MKRSPGHCCAPHEHSFGCSRSLSRAWPCPRRHRRVNPPSRKSCAWPSKAAQQSSPERTRALARRARLAGLVPTLKVGAERGLQQDLSASSGGDAERTNASLGDDLSVDASLTFELPRLVFAPEEVRLLSVDRWLLQDRKKLFDEVVRLYFQRRRLLARACASDRAGSRARLGDRRGCRRCSTPTPTARSRGPWLRPRQRESPLSARRAALAHFFLAFATSERISPSTSFKGRGSATAAGCGVSLPPAALRTSARSAVPDRTQRCPSRSKMRKAPWLMPTGRNSERLLAIGPEQQHQLAVLEARLAFDAHGHAIDHAAQATHDHARSRCCGALLGPLDLHLHIRDDASSLVVRAALTHHASHGDQLGLLHQLGQVHRLHQGPEGRGATSQDEPNGQQCRPRRSRKCARARGNRTKPPANCFHLALGPRRRGYTSRTASACPT